MGQCFECGDPRHHTTLHGARPWHKAKYVPPSPPDPKDIPAPPVEDASRTKLAHNYSAKDIGDRQRGVTVENAISLRFVVVRLKGFGDREVVVNALLDDGSNRSLLATEVADALKLDMGRKHELSLIGVSGNVVRDEDSHLVKFQIESLDGKTSTFMHAATLEDPTGTLWPTRWNRFKGQWPHFAGIHFEEGPDEPVKMLIGSDYGHLMCSWEDRLPKMENEVVPIARLTPLGWTATGPLVPQKEHRDVRTLLVEETSLFAKINNTILWGLRPKKKSGDTGSQGNNESGDAGNPDPPDFRPIGVVAPRLRQVFTPQQEFALEVIPELDGDSDDEGNEGEIPQSFFLSHFPASFPEMPDGAGAVSTEDSEPDQTRGFLECLLPESNETSGDDVGGATGTNRSHVAKAASTRELERLLAQSMEMDKYPGDDTEETQSHQDDYAIKLMDQTRVLEDGRYKVSVLWKEGEPDLPNNYADALLRLKSLERSPRMRDPNLQKQYWDHIWEWVEKGYFRVVPTENCRIREHEDVKVGEVVALIEAHHVGLWPGAMSGSELGRIVKVHPGKDGRVRSVDVEVVVPKDKDTVEVRDERKTRWNAKKCGRTCLLPKKILNRDITRLIRLHVEEEENSPGNEIDKSPEPGDEGDDGNRSEIEDSQENGQGKSSPGEKRDRRVKFLEDGENSPGDKTDGRKVPGANPDGRESPGAETDGQEVPREKSDGRESPGEKSNGRKIPGEETDGRESPGVDFDGQEVPEANSDGQKSPGEENDGRKSHGESDTYENYATDLGNRNTGGKNPKRPRGTPILPVEGLGMLGSLPHDLIPPGQDVMRRVMEPLGEEVPLLLEDESDRVTGSDLMGGRYVYGHENGVNENHLYRVPPLNLRRINGLFP